jgi:hypothetical protein
MHPDYAKVKAWDGMTSEEHFAIAAEHAAWCGARGQQPEEVLSAIGVGMFPHEFPPDWTRVIEELARAHLHLTVTR